MNEKTVSVPTITVNHHRVRYTAPAIEMEIDRASGFDFFDDRFAYFPLRRGAKRQIKFGIAIEMRRDVAGVKPCEILIGPVNFPADRGNEIAISCDLIGKLGGSLFRYSRREAGQVELKVIQVLADLRPI